MAQETADFSRLREIVPPLLGWYDRCARTLPWRSDPTPYHVLVSEIMLQQTRVEAVREHYARFLEELPDLRALAEAPEERLLKLWEGLGYYSRARNLQKCAKAALREYGGKLPEDPALLRRLPGIGDYCAGSIASIAYGVRAPAVDGNVLRVVSRLAASDGDVAQPAVKRELTARVTEILPDDRCGDFNQALMDLGATVCLPNGAPLCEACPLRALCIGYARGIAASLPVRTKKPARRAEEIGVLLLSRNGRLALRRRPEKGLLAGLWELPTFSGDAAAFCAENCLDCTPPVPGEKGKHIFTHVEWRMTGWRAESASDGLPEGWVWASFSEIAEKYALPSAFSTFFAQKVDKMEK